MEHSNQFFLRQIFLKKNFTLLANNKGLQNAIPNLSKAEQSSTSTGSVSEKSNFTNLP